MNVSLVKTLRGGYDLVQTQRILVFPDIADSGLAMDESFRFFAPPPSGPTTPITFTENTSALSDYAWAFVVLEAARRRFEEAEKAFRASDIAATVRAHLNPQPRSLPTYTIFPEKDITALRNYIETGLGGQILNQHIKTSGYDCGEIRFQLRNPVVLNATMFADYMRDCSIFPFLERGETLLDSPVSEIVYRKRGQMIPPYAQEDWNEFQQHRRS